MAKVERSEEVDELVVRAKRDSQALGRLYELHYERIFRFCVHRLFSKDFAEEVSSSVFLDVARQMRSFPGLTSKDFKNWLYAIAVNHCNAWIRKTLRRRKLFEKAVLSRPNDRGRSDEVDWAQLYAAISRLKPKHQTIVTLRYFENLSYEQVAKIVNASESSVRVTMHRVLKKLRSHLQAVVDGD